ncbi:MULTISPECIES: NnrU family protein [unclassified Labrenzia]|uniref:NnrU family protein n=1 Tax=unclassified Labrenzia TaxID=2648686 RepID=UPI002570D451|nr:MULTISPECIES: NnrU family protein [unclassified Labrenzia]
MTIRVMYIDGAARFRKRVPVESAPAMLSLNWLNFIAAFLVFFASHMVLVRPPLRPLLVAFLSPRGFSLGYSLLSLGILWWLIVAARDAPYIALWPWEPWQTYVPVLMMLPVCLILAFGIGAPNPFSFGGRRNNRFDPERPGIVGLMRHPILVAAFLWSVAHVVPNGDLAHVILFGTFAVFSLAGMKLIDRRKQREMGNTWNCLLADMKRSSSVAPVDWQAILIRATAGFVLYIVLAVAHPLFAGVDPVATLMP